MAAAVVITLKPFGANPPYAVKLDGVKNTAPIATKNRMIATFRTTINVFDVADSRMPYTRMAVIKATITTAAMLKMKGMPKKCGALETADARYVVAGSVAPPATASTAV